MDLKAVFRNKLSPGIVILVALGILIPNNITTFAPHFNNNTMKKTLQMLIVFAFLFVGWNNQANAQTCQWAKQSSQGYIWEQDWSGFQSGTLIFTTDANNNAIVAGGFVSDTFKLDTVILTRKEYGCTFLLQNMMKMGICYGLDRHIILC